MTRVTFVPFPAPSQVGPLRAIRAVLGWPVGLTVVSLQYLWRTTAIHRSEVEGNAADLPADVPPELVDERSKLLPDGVGVMLRRHFSVVIRGSDLDPEALMATLRDNPNQAAPSHVAYFAKTRGADGPITVGDEYVVRMPGPWDGPVRVIDQTATSFRFGTLQHHLEAGQIEFRCLRDGDRLRFEIETWARAGDRLSHLFYSQLKFSKEIQLNMWLHFCLGAAKVARGRTTGGVTIRTKVVPEALVA